MKYKVNEIFYSIQAEGRNAGKPAIFVRFAGCNLKCPFCDTDHEPYKEYTADELENAVNELDRDAKGQAIVVLTGGEPTLQLREDEPLFQDRFIAMETNGILLPPSWIDWVTVSPKSKGDLHWNSMDELKVLYGWFDDDYLIELGEKARLHGVKCYIQPMADENDKFDALPAVNFAKEHPDWTLSIQFHKLLNIR